MRSLMAICVKVILVHKHLLDAIMALEKSVLTDVFESIKTEMQKNKMHHNIFKKHFTKSYRLPYTIVLGSSPPSQKQYFNGQMHTEEVWNLQDDFESDESD